MLYVITDPCYSVYTNKVHLYSLLPSEMDNYDDNDFEDDEYDE